MGKVVAILKNDEICYQSLLFFSKEIEVALQQQGIETETVSVIDEAFMGKHWDGVIGINQQTMSVQLPDGSFLFDYLNCPLFVLIVDPPYHHDKLLRAHPKNMHLICLDEGHAEYAKNFYGPFLGVHMATLIGGVTEPIPYEQRTTRVLFAGTRADTEMIRQKTQQWEMDWARKLFGFLIEEGIAHPEVSTEKKVLEFFRKMQMDISKEDYKFAMAMVGTQAEFYLRGYYREQIIRVLAEADVPVTILGNGWEQMKASVTLLDSVPFEKVADYMADAQIVLNVMPWFKDGCHDRIPTGMLNGAIVVTDGSSYLRREFEDGKDICFYDLEHLEELPKQIHYLLQNPQQAAAIAKAGYEKAGREYGWDRLVQETIVPYL